DELVRLQWRTGYKGDVVKDKLERSLNYKLAERWAAERDKPYAVEEQIQLLREIGHNLERYDQSRRLDKGKGKADDRPGPSSRKPEENKAEKQKGKKDKKRKRDDEKEWKDKSVKLAGIPADILKERMTAGSCQKCGKSNHMWYDCYSKEAVKTRVAGSKKTCKEGSNPQISAVRATETERRIEELEDSDMEILDYGTD